MNCIIVALLLVFAASLEAKERHLTTAAIMGNTNWGSIKVAQLCPEGTKVTGFRVKLEKNTDKDKTGLNGIQLSCSDGSTSRAEPGYYGKWQDWEYCHGDGGPTATDFVTGFNYRSLGKQGRKDDIAGTDLQMICSNKKVLTGNGYDLGVWDREGYAGCSATSYFCGVQIQVENPSRDTTGMNHVRFFCCSVSNIIAPPIEGWKVLASDICIGTMNGNFGVFQMPTEGFLESIRIDHLYGKVTCNNRDKGYSSNFGCRYYRLQIDFGIFITTHADILLLPRKGSVHSIRRGWYRLPGLDATNAQSFVLSDKYEPAYIQKGEEIRLWYGEDYYNQQEGNNGKKDHSCVNVYGKFL